MIKEHKLLLHPPLFHFDHLVIKSSDHYLDSHPFYYFRNLGSTDLIKLSTDVYIKELFGANLYFVCTTDI